MPNELFNHQWQIYQKVLKHNYMGHQEIYQIWREFLNRFCQQPFKLLDLGCGDACFTSQFLRDSNLVARINKKNYSILKFFGMLVVKLDACTKRHFFC
jgi:hypothetical protein